MPTQASGHLQVAEEFGWSLTYEARPQLTVSGSHFSSEQKKCPALFRAGQTALGGEMTTDVVISL